jgi:hypothetical protein
MRARGQFETRDRSPQRARESGVAQGGRRVSLAPHASVLELEAKCERALSLYGVRALDNVDLSRLDTIAARAFVIGRALMERGDLRAFALGRDILSFIET